MNLSKTVIPVLSNNFARSEWCLFQLAVARNKITKAGNMSIFPIMLDEIEFQHMHPFKIFIAIDNISYICKFILVMERLIASFH
jgi:hypothetical protein